MKTELEGRLHRLDRVESPDLWADAASRTPRPPRHEPSGLRTAALVVACLAIVAASLVLLARAFDHGGSSDTRLPANRPGALPANGEIWAAGGGGEGGSSIFSVDPFTGEETLLWHDGRSPTLPPDKANVGLVATDYAWSPDGSRVAFSHVVSPPPGFVGVWIPFEEIYVMNPDGSGLSQLTHDSAHDAFPSWSPDGTTILFTSYRGNSYEPGCLDLWSCPGDLYQITLDGASETQVTSGASADSMASWSPDGKRIACRTTRDGSRGHIFVMNADGSGIRQLTSGSEFDLAPLWSPDGEQIAFLGSGQEPGDTFHVWVVQTDGSGRHELADTKMDTAPGPALAWSPDGTEIAFPRMDVPGEASIYLMDEDGSRQRKLADLSGYGMSLAPITWRPLPGSSPG
jgi:Tol biopolymer transport system component